MNTPRRSRNYPSTSANGRRRNARCTTSARRRAPATIRCWRATGRSRAHCDSRCRMRCRLISRRSRRARGCRPRMHRRTLRIEQRLVRALVAPAGVVGGGRGGAVRPAVAAGDLAVLLPRRRVELDAGAGGLRRPVVVVRPAASPRKAAAADTAARRTCSASRWHSRRSHRAIASHSRRRSDSTSWQPRSMGCCMRRSCLLAVGFSASVLACSGCGEYRAARGARRAWAREPLLPEPRKSLIPTVEHRPRRRLGRRRPRRPRRPASRSMPSPPACEHPRWLYVLPNGDVLVAETNAPPKPDDGKGIKGWFMKSADEEGRRRRAQRQPHHPAARRRRRRRRRDAQPCSCRT